jgi:hypothetical protein
MLFAVVLFGFTLLPPPSTYNTLLTPLEAFVLAVAVTLVQPVHAIASGLKREDGTAKKDDSKKSGTLPVLS